MLKMNKHSYKYISINLIIILCFNFSFQENLYYNNVYVTNYTNIAPTNRTTIISESKSISPCDCNITPNVCDTYCCCDEDCNNNIIDNSGKTINFIENWEKNINLNYCKNKNNEDFYNLLNCEIEDNIFSSDILNNINIFKFNKDDFIDKYLVYDSISPLRKLLCAIFDNSGHKGRFFKNANKLDLTYIIDVYKKYIDNLSGKYYYENLNSGVNLDIDSESYQINQYVLTKRINSVNYKDDGKMFTVSPNSNGICKRINPVLFLKDSVNNQCIISINEFINCDKYNWKNQLMANLEIASNPSINAYYNRLNLNSIYTKDYNTGHIEEIDISSLIDSDSDNSNININNNLNYSLKLLLNKLPDTEVIINDINSEDDNNYVKNNKSTCTCNNILSELVYHFNVNEKLNKIIDFKIDVVLIKNYNNLCYNKLEYIQTHSHKFSQVINNYKKSGNPGYKLNSNLLIAYETTNNNNSKFLNIQNSGFSVSGRSNLDGSCVLSDLQKDNFYYNNNSIVKFNQEIDYTCNLELSLEQLKNICQNSSKDNNSNNIIKFSSYLIYNQINKIQYIGIFGNSNPVYLKVSLDYNFILN